MASFEGPLDGENQPERLDEFVAKATEKSAVYKLSIQREKEKRAFEKEDLEKLTGKCTEDIEQVIAQYKLEAADSISSSKNNELTLNMS